MLRLRSIRSGLRASMPRQVLSGGATCAVVVSCCVLTASSARADVEYTMTPVTVPGAFETFGFALNNNGVVVGAAVFGASAQIPHAFRWRAAGGGVDLGTFGELNARATGINDNGEIAV